MTTAPDIAQRRADVARLRSMGHSIRQISDELDVPAATVHRDVQALERDTKTAPDQDTNPPVSPAIVAVACPDPRQTETPGHPTETGNRDTETPLGPCIAVPVDTRILADLLTLTRNGISPEAAIRHALGHLAHTYRQAWNAGLYPRDTNPVIARQQFAPHRPNTQP